MSPDELNEMGYAFIKACHEEGVDLPRMSQQDVEGLFHLFCAVEATTIKATKTGQLHTQARKFAKGLAVELEMQKEEEKAYESDRRAKEKAEKKKREQELKEKAMLLKQKQLQEAQAAEQAKKKLLYEFYFYPSAKAMTGGQIPMKDLLRLHAEGKISDETLLTEFQVLGALGEEKLKIERKKRPEKELEKLTPGGRLLDV